MDSVTQEENVIGSDNTCHKKINFQNLITSEDVDIIMKRAFGLKCKIINYQIKLYSEEQLGFLGAHRHLVVTIQRPGNEEKEINTFFLKSIPYDNEEQTSIIVESNAFHKETNFYKQIAPELMKDVKDKSWLAKCYLVKDDILVFEDLKTKNYFLKDRFLDVNALKSALTAFAKFHASSLLAEKRLGKTFRQLYPGILEECLFVRTGKFYKWFNTGVDVIVAIAKYLGLNDRNIPRVCDRMFDLILTSKVRQNVVSHGDPKSFNILFDNSEPVPKCVLVDFQLTRYVPPMADILQLLYLSARKHIREEHEEMLLRYYHKVLCDTLRENEGIKLPSLHEILQEYEEMRLVGIVTAALYFPIYLIDAKECAEIIKNTNGFSKLVFDDRVDFILKIMKKNVVYNEIITEIVTELVQRSEKLISS